MWLKGCQFIPCIWLVLCLMALWQCSIGLLEPFPTIRTPSISALGLEPGTLCFLALSSNTPWVFWGSFFFFFLKKCLKFLLYTFNLLCKTDCLCEFILSNFVFREGFSRALRLLLIPCLRSTTTPPCGYFENFNAFLMKHIFIFFIVALNALFMQLEMIRGVELKRQHLLKPLILCPTQGGRAER